MELSLLERCIKEDVEALLVWSKTINNRKAEILSIMLYLLEEMDRHIRELEEIYD